MDRLLDPIWEAAFRVATWAVAAFAAYAVVYLVTPSRSLLERLALMHACGACFTLLMQTYTRFDQCVGALSCVPSFSKGFIWSMVWPVAWTIGRGASWWCSPCYGLCLRDRQEAAGLRGRTVAS